MALFCPQNKDFILFNPPARKLHKPSQVRGQTKTLSFASGASSIDHRLSTGAAGAKVHSAKPR